MTGERDIERILDTWFTDGPTRMPDGFVDRMFGRIEAVPQSRLARLRARAFSTKPNIRSAPKLDVRLGAVIALVVVVVLAGVTVITRAPATGALPSASPSPTEPPSTPPTALLGNWIPVGPPSPSARFSAGRIEFAPGNVMMHVGSIRFYSSWTLIGPDRFELVLLPDPVDPTTYLSCNSGDDGTYAFRLASNGFLTLSSLADACAARAEILTTTWARYDPPPPQTFPPP